MVSPNSGRVAAWTRAAGMPRQAPAPGSPFPDLSLTALLREEINAWVNEGGRGDDPET